MILLKTPAKQSHRAVSTKIKFDQSICLHENRNRGDISSSFLDVLVRNLLFKNFFKQNPNGRNNVRTF